MQATIDTLFVNEKVIKIYSFRPNAFKSEYCDKTPSHFPPPNPLKYLTMWGGGWKKRMYVYIVRFKEYIEFKYLYKNIVSV